MARALLHTGTAPGATPHPPETDHGHPCNQRPRQLPRTCPRRRVRGAGGQWVFGWIRPFVPSSPLPLGTVINFYEINYSFYADQMNNQFQNIDIRNNAPNANINVQGDQGARNDGRLDLMLI
ncbi:hypothetical protein [Cupriavidus sp. UYPR2.512]|uniref:hypothetical protein n=1 Tax=Cupriavidus sp. UYPR2.512 TaxID=1080187 RepID=UPI001E315F3D|nr:hypothetical protein [Cupriavidus sp. UYPR2.512]